MKHCEESRHEDDSEKQVMRKLSARSRKYFVDEQDLFFDDNYKDTDKERWGEFGFECGELVNE